MKENNNCNNRKTNQYIWTWASLGRIFIRFLRVHNYTQVVNLKFQLRDVNKSPPPLSLCWINNIIGWYRRDVDRNKVDSKAVMSGT